LPFAYYHRLTKAQKRIYDESDRVVTSVTELYRPELQRERVLALQAALESGERASTERAAQALADGLTVALGVPRLRIQLAERRPSSRTGELHGLYEADEEGHYKVSLWMRTAQRQQVVKFKTFLRTMLHELGHHLDYQKLGLKDSFHTEGFYRRESSLLRQLFPSESSRRSRLRLSTARL